MTINLAFLFFETDAMTMPRRYPVNW